MNFENVWQNMKDGIPKDSTPPQQPERFATEDVSYQSLPKAEKNGCLPTASGCVVQRSLAGN
jgi:hypothetical protein